MNIQISKKIYLTEAKEDHSFRASVSLINYSLLNLKVGEKNQTHPIITKFEY